MNAIFVFVFQLEQERLKWRIDELNQMLIEEKHNNRKDKLAVAKLQQEVSRHKSERAIVSTHALPKVPSPNPPISYHLICILHQFFFLTFNHF